MGKLNPCPLCAGEAMAQENHWRDGNLRGGEPFCKKCGLKMPRHWPRREAEAITAWNTRPLPQPSELVEWLFAEIAHGDEAHREWLLNALKSSPALAQIAKLQADGDKLAFVLRETKAGIEHGRLDEHMCCSGHMCGCQGSTNADYLLHLLTQALTEWKDRA